MSSVIENMPWAEAWEQMLSGTCVKLPSWSGYWYWNAETDDIIMVLKDGTSMRLVDTKDQRYTFSNMANNEWMVATEENCPVLRGEYVAE